MSIFKPKEKLKRFTEFDASKYKDAGFKAIFLDIDNTITLPNVGELTDEAKNFIDKLYENDFKVIIFSNNTIKRVKSFVGDYNVKWFAYSLKPLPFAYWVNCIRIGVRPSKTIVLGDQLLTDILGANLSGCYGIYTKQLQAKDTTLTARNRKIEKLIWRYILHEEV